MVQQDHLAKGGTVEQPEAFYLLELSCQVGGVCAAHGGVSAPSCWSDIAAAAF